MIGLSVCLSVHGVSAMKALLKAIVQNTSVGIQRLHNSQARDPLERLRKVA